MNWVLIFQLIGLLGLPLFGWAIGALNAQRKIVAARDQEIMRLNSVRDTEFERINKAEHSELHTMFNGLKNAMERMVQASYDTRIEIAQQYATMIALRETEKRFFEGMKRLEEKLDRALDKGIIS